MLPSQVTALVVRVDTPAFPGTCHMLQHNPDGVAVRIIGIDTNAHAAERFAVDAFHPVVSYEHPDFIDQMAGICEREGVDVVLVQHDIDAQMLSKQIGRFREQGTHLVLSSHASIAQSRDKAHLLKICAQLGVPCPAYRVLRSPDELREAARELGYPDRTLAIKPTSMWGSCGYRVLTESTHDAYSYFQNRDSGRYLALDGLEAILQRSDEMPPLLLMEYLPGREYSVDAFRGRHVETAIPRIRHRIHGSLAMETELEKREDIEAYTLQVAQALDLDSMFGMQFRLNDEGIPCILECNPRIQGTSIASLFSGINLVWLAVREALGRPATELSKRVSSGRYTRCWSGIAHRDTWHQQI